MNAVMCAGMTKQRGHKQIGWPALSVTETADGRYSPHTKHAKATGIATPLPQDPEYRSKVGDSVRF
jgi:hypothetical protein